MPYTAFRTAYNTNMVHRATDIAITRYRAPSETIHCYEIMDRKGMNQPQLMKPGSEG